jgi:tryptophanyl-tRNA synthetase
MQAAHILYPSVKHNLPVVVPVGIDQDIFIKLSRDVASKLNLPKPAALLSKFLPGLDGNAKMSASKQQTSIYLTDKPAEVKKKVMRAFTGGKPTVEEQRKEGGNPDICSVYTYLKYFFLSDKEIKKLESDCKSGKILCGDCKKLLAEKAVKFIEEHQKKREKMRKVADKLLKS